MILEIENMTGGYSYPVSTYQQRKWFESLSNRQNELRLIIDTEEHGAIGVVMLTDIDLKNRTAQTHSKITSRNNLRGKGYGTKASKALVNMHLKDLNLHCLYSQTIDYNIASQREGKSVALKRKVFYGKGFIKTVNITM